MSLRDPNAVRKSKPKRVAIVIANPSTSTTTGWPVGFWWSELTHPYFAFHEAGYEVEIFSPAGGKCEADGMSDPRDASGYSASDLINMGFLSTPSLAALVAQTRPVSEISVAKFDAIVVAGGQAPMFSFEKAIDLHNKFVEFYKENWRARCATASRSSSTPSSRTEATSRRERPSPACVRPDEPRPLALHAAWWTA